MCAPPQTFSHYPAWPAPVRLPLVTIPDHPCVYLPGRMTRIRAFQTDRMAPGMYDQFMNAGFRRSGRIIYQPVCHGCRACVPIRLMVRGFRPSKSQRRCSRSNADLRIELSTARATGEEYDLYCRYIKQWHKGAAADVSREGFERFLCESPVKSIKMMYRDMSNRLLAVGICDISSDALSSVYFYFDPSHRRRGLGTYGVLCEIDYAARNGMAAYYLGYWVEACASMRYKSGFRPNQVLGTDGCWRAAGATRLVNRRLLCNSEFASQRTDCIAPKSTRQVDWMGSMLSEMTLPTERILPKKSRVLVVEDHAPTRLAMSKLLRDAGAEVVTARDGEEGLGYLLAQKFDILLTDLRMPVMDGFELVQHCMSLPEARRPGRIVAISGEYEANALRGAPVSFMAKPFNLDTLLNMLGGKPN